MTESNIKYRSKIHQNGWKVYTIFVQQGDSLTINAHLNVANVKRVPTTQVKATVVQQVRARLRAIDLYNFNRPYDLCQRGTTIGHIPTDDDTIEEPGEGLMILLVPGDKVAIDVRVNAPGAAITKGKKDDGGDDGDGGDGGGREQSFSFNLKIDQSSPADFVAPITTSVHFKPYKKRHTSVKGSGHAPFGDFRSSHG